MKKVILAGALLIVCVIGTGYLWFTWVVAGHTKASSTASQELLSKSALDCPSETVRSERAWGKAGWMIFCEREEVKHGPWMAAENGRLVLRGYYQQGKELGVWEWYDEDGNVTKRVTYAHSPK